MKSKIISILKDVSSYYSKFSSKEKKIRIIFECLNCKTTYDMTTIYKDKYTLTCVCGTELESENEKK